MFFVREAVETLVRGKIMFCSGVLVFVCLFVDPDFTISMVVGVNSLFPVLDAERNSKTNH